jgi:hypothetical protein
MDRSVEANEDGLATLEIDLRVDLWRSALADSEHTDYNVFILTAQL